MKKRPPVWTKKDLADLQQLATRKGRFINWKRLLKRFPTRTQRGITKQLFKHRFIHAGSWTAQEDHILRSNWLKVPPRILRSKLPPRTGAAIYNHALRIGLKAGCPQGYVSVTSLSKSPKWGYGYKLTLAILKFSKVRIRKFGYTGRSKRSGTMHVEEMDAIRAADAWSKAQFKLKSGKENPCDAAERFGLAPSTIWRWLTLSGLVPPKTINNKRTFLADPNVYDQVVKLHHRQALSTIAEPGSPVQTRPRKHHPRNTPHPHLQASVERLTVQR